MLNKSKLFLNYIKNFIIGNKVWFVFIIVVLLISFFIKIRGAESNGKNNFEVIRGDFEKTVEISGKVISSSKASLSFDVGGVIEKIYKKAGDTVSSGEILVSLEKRELLAKRQKAEAEYDSALAELEKIKNTSSSGVDILNKKKEAIEELQSAYTYADDAIRNKVDQFYSNPRSDGPKIKYTFYDYFDLKDELNVGRKAIEKVLNEWSVFISSVTIENFSIDFIEKSKNYLYQIKSFLDKVSLAANSFEESYDLSVSQIESFKSNVSTARINVNNSIKNLTSAESSLNSLANDIAVQEANVKASLANIADIDAQISKTILRAPFSGVVSVLDLEEGESLGAHTEVVSIIGENLEVEAFVPELSISGISLDAESKVRFDAIPKKVYIAKISHIDPAETEKDGLASYKIKISLDGNSSEDLRLVKSGMTADVSIKTLSKKDVLLISDEAILKEENEDGERWFLLIPEGEKSYKKIEIDNKSLLDSKGRREVVEESHIITSGTKVLDPNNLGGRKEVSI